MTKWWRRLFRRTPIPVDVEQLLSSGKRIDNAPQRPPQEFIFFDRPLTAAEIAALKKAYEGR